MSLKINSDNIITDEIIFKDTSEQNVELDYILPDYYPEIFRIIRCTGSAYVSSCGVNGKTLSYEISASLRIIYCGQGNNIRTVEKELTYPMTSEISDAISPKIIIEPFFDYISCRAVTGRRIDVHGLISVRICVSAEKQTPVITDAFGDNIILKKESFLTTDNKLQCDKKAVVSEDIAIGSEKPPVTEILRESAAILSCDKKAVEGKLAVKGDIRVNILYSSEDNTVEPLQFTVPYSHILNMDGLDDSYEIRVRTKILCCKVNPKSDSENSDTLECNITLYIFCTAEKKKEIKAAVDEFSPDTPTEHKSEEIKTNLPAKIITKSQTVKSTASLVENTIDTVYDSWCEANPFSYVRESDGTITAVGKVNLFAAAKNKSGETVIISGSTPVSISDLGEGNVFSEDFICDINVYPVSSSYNISSDNTVEITGEIVLDGEIDDFGKITALTEIKCDENSEKTKSESFGIKLYFAEKDESLWEIAKRCHTSPEIIMEENGLDSQICKESGMLVIPVLS